MQPFLINLEEKQNSFIIKIRGIKNFMKKILLLCFVLCTFLCSKAYCEENTTAIINDMMLQQKINNIGVKLLNSNKIDVRLVFVYDKKDNKINSEPVLRKRQIIVYKNFIQFAENDEEIAAFLAREICKGAESYTGGKGVVTSAQVAFAPKKFEIFFDKRAVDFMVTAGYNPLALITFINKSYPQRRFDKFGRTNLTSKRLANIYEYIFTKYPSFLANNTYLENPNYQNFLITSQENRKKLHEKIKSGSKEIIKYE